MESSNHVKGPGGGIVGIVVMGLRFGLELASLAAIGIWGQSLAEQPILRWGLALLLPLLVATV